MPSTIDKNRIQGFGSDGANDKVWACPAGHLLQPWKATPGTCDGCSRRVCKGDSVMDCRRCNWYLCEECHPQEKPEQDWFWGSIQFISDAVKQETEEIASEFKEMASDFETFVTDMSPFSACTAAQVDKSSETDFTNDREDFSSYEGVMRGKKNKGKNNDRGRRSDAIHEEEDETARLSSSSREAENDNSASASASAEPKPKEEPAPKAEEAPKKTPPAPMEDLMDLGQPDLLDLTFSPAAAAEATAQVAEAVQSATAAPSETAPPPSVPAQPPAATTDDLLDFDFGAPAAPPAATLNVEPPLPVVGGGAAEGGLLLDFSDPTPAPAPVVAAPAVTTEAAPVTQDSSSLLDFDSAPAPAAVSLAAPPKSAFGLGAPPAPSTSLLVG